MSKSNKDGVTYTIQKEMKVKNRNERETQYVLVTQTITPIHPALALIVKEILSQSKLTPIEWIVKTIETSQVQASRILIGHRMMTRKQALKIWETINRCLIWENISKIERYLADEDGVSIIKKQLISNQLGNDAARHYAEYDVRKMERLGYKFSRGKGVKNNG